MHTCHSICRDQSTTLRTQFSSFMVLGIKLRLSVLVANTSPHWAIIQLAQERDFDSHRIPDPLLFAVYCFHFCTVKGLLLYWSQDWGSHLRSWVGGTHSNSHIPSPGFATLKNKSLLGIIVYTCNTSTSQAEAGRWGQEPVSKEKREESQASVVYIYSPSTWEAHAEDWEFKTSLGCI